MRNRLEKGRIWLWAFGWGLDCGSGCSLANVVRSLHCVCAVGLGFVEWVVSGASFDLYCGMQTITKCLCGWRRDWCPD